MNSLSSSLIYGTTLYRNQTGEGKIIHAQFGYALIAVVSAVETVAALAFSGLSLLMLPFSSAPLADATTWLSSSAFSFGWSIVDFILNPFVDPLVADEKSARAIVRSGNLMSLPPGAVLYRQ